MRGRGLGRWTLFAGGMGFVLAGCRGCSLPESRPVRSDWATVRCYQSRSFARPGPPQGMPPDEEFSCPHGGEFFCPDHRCQIVELSRRDRVYGIFDVTTARPYFLLGERKYIWLVNPKYLQDGGDHDAQDEAPLGDLGRLVSGDGGRL